MANVMGDKLRWKMDMMERVLNYHARLVALYQYCDSDCEQLGIKGSPSVVLRNALSNSITIGLSANLLLAQGFHGSARVLRRHFLEMMLVAKHALYDPAVDARFEAQDERSRTALIVGHHILNHYWPSPTRETRSPLHELWSKSHLYVHHTPFAQQPILISPLPRTNATNAIDYEDFQNIREAHAATDESLDATFLLHCMANHLLTRHYAGFCRYYLTQYGAATGLHEHEAMLRAASRRACRAYWRRNAQHGKGLNELWLPALRQYVSDWKRPRRPKFS